MKYFHSFVVAAIIISLATTNAKAQLNMQQDIQHASVGHSIVNIQISMCDYKFPCRNFEIARAPGNYLKQ